MSLLIAVGVSVGTVILLFGTVLVLSQIFS